jgi:hypothetical protein
MNEHKSKETAKPQGDGQGFLFQSIDVTLDEYYNRRKRTKPNQRRILDLEFIGRIQCMHEPWMPILPEDAPQPTDRLLEAAKAVAVQWGKPNYDAVPYVFINLMEKMIKEIRTIEATQGGNNK